MKMSIKQFLQNSVSPKVFEEKNFEKEKESSNKNSLKESPLKFSIDKNLNNSRASKLQNSKNIYIEDVSNSSIESEPLDYRIEIEKRFKESVVNKIYSFPRKFEVESNSGASNSTDNSLESMKNVEFYDLQDQNYKKIYLEEKENNENDRKNMGSFSVHNTKAKTPNNNLNKEKINMGVNYKSFINLLEKTMKNVNKADLKKIKINDFFKKDCSTTQNVITDVSKQKENSIRESISKPFTMENNKNLKKRLPLQNFKCNFSQTANNNNTSISIGKRYNSKKYKCLSYLFLFICLVLTKH